MLGGQGRCHQMTSSAFHLVAVIADSADFAGCWWASSPSKYRPHQLALFEAAFLGFSFQLWHVPWAIFYPSPGSLLNRAAWLGICHRAGWAPGCP